MREKITIVDCGIGNLSSVSNAFKSLGAKVTITSTPKGIEEAQRIVTPGVGAFGYFMEQLRSKGLEEPLLRAIKEKKPYLGLCLGMQILFGKSEENPDSTGLGVLNGKVVKFEKGKVPQVGWNYVISAKDSALNDGYAYFTNSYYCKPENQNCVIGVSDYFGKFACAVRKGNVFAVQFHPERSGKYGLEFLRRWLEC